MIELTTSPITYTVENNEIPREDERWFLHEAFCW